MSASGKSERREGAGLSRRGFMMHLAAAGSGLAAWAALSSTRAEPSGAPDGAAEKVSRGYHETQHIRDYYRTAAL